MSIALSVFIRWCVPITEHLINVITKTGDKEATNKSKG